MSESITVKFDTDLHDIVHVTLDYNIETVPPKIVVQALRDLANDEERSYKAWNALWKRRN